MKIINQILFIALLTTISLSAQIDKNSEIFLTLKKQDSIFFERGFNLCDLEYLNKAVHKDLMFYHDQSGIQNRAIFLANTTKYICGDTIKKPIRKVVKESLEVFPLYDNGVLYGAIQSGIHDFYIREKNKADVHTSSAKFTHLYLLENGNWLLKEVLSFDHQESENNSPKITMFENETEIEKFLIENKIPTLGIGNIRNGKLQQVKVFGTLNKNIIAPYNTIFNVASLTKPITAIITLKLVSQGKWNLDEPLYKYWIDPDIAKYPTLKTLTTRHVLSHQTGFPNWRYMNKSGKLDFKFKPGTKYEYSGEGFEYLRKALESKFHKTLDQLASELIFKKLNMNDTEFFWTKNTEAERFAIGYDNKGIAYETIKNKSTNAADDLLTTIEDYGNFLVSVMNGDGLSKKVFDDMKTNQVKTKNGKHFGLGFEIYDLGNGEIALSHGGSDKGVQTIFFIFPKSKNGLLIFTNVDDGYKVFEKIISNYLGRNGRKLIEIELGK